MNLSDHPNESLATANDDEARALLLKEGLLEKLNENGPEECSLPNQVRWFVVRDNPTHWIIAIRFFGFSQPSENGYLVRCFSKRQVSREEFELQAKAEQEDLFRKHGGNLPPHAVN